MSIERIRKKLSFNNYISNNSESIKPMIGEFEKFIDKHNGSNFIICGCGNSLNTLEAKGSNILIGVNDIGRKIDPDYLIVVNKLVNFKRGRWEYVYSSKAEYIFTHIKDLPIERPEKLIHINLGKYEGTDINNFGFIDYVTNSPYMAIIIAYQMGARKIGIIGIDFTQNHFFEKSGTHPINREIDRVLEQYKNLGNALINNGVIIANLSKESLVTSWPQMSFEQFEKL